MSRTAAWIALFAAAVFSASPALARGGRSGGGGGGGGRAAPQGGASRGAAPSRSAAAPRASMPQGYSGGYSRGMSGGYSRGLSGTSRSSGFTSRGIPSTRGAAPSSSSGRGFYARSRTSPAQASGVTGFTGTRSLGTTRQGGAVGSPTRTRAAPSARGTTDGAATPATTRGFTGSRNAGTTARQGGAVGSPTRTRAAPSARGTTDGAATPATARGFIGTRSAGATARQGGAGRTPSAGTRGFTGTRDATARQGAATRGGEVQAQRGAGAQAASAGRGYTRTRDYVYRGGRYGYRYPAYGYPRYPYYGYGYGYPYYPGGCYGYHGYYNSGFYLSFSFGSGVYFGFRYYWPYYNYVSGCHYGFFYPYPVSYAYVPYGFYCDAPATYVTRTVYVRDDYARTDYETVEEAPEADPEKAEVVDPKPAAGSPATEKFLRDASDAFREADYAKAAERFRLAALSAPEQSGPLFALGQSLLALGDDPYAARVLRKALAMSPDLVKEPGDLVGVYKSQEEFDRVLAELEKRALEAPPAGDARFLLAFQRYFTGDPRCREDLGALAAALPGDPAVAVLDEGAKDRFKGAEELPPIR